MPPQPYSEERSAAVHVVYICVLLCVCLCGTLFDLDAIGNTCVRKRNCLIAASVVDAITTQ